MLDALSSLERGTDPGSGSSYAKKSTVSRQASIRDEGREALNAGCRREGGYESRKGAARTCCCSGIYRSLLGSILAILLERTSVTRLGALAGRRSGATVESRGSFWFWLSLVEAGALCGATLGVVHCAVPSVGFVSRIWPDSRETTMIRGCRSSQVG